MISDREVGRGCSWLQWRRQVRAVSYARIARAKAATRQGRSRLPASRERVSFVPLPERRCDQLSGNAHITLNTAINRHRCDVFIAHDFAGPRQTRTDDACKIARAEPTRSKPLGEGHEIVCAEGIFKF